MSLPSFRIALRWLLPWLLNSAPGLLGLAPNRALTRPPVPLRRRDGAMAHDLLERRDRSVLEPAAGEGVPGHVDVKSRHRPPRVIRQRLRILHVDEPSDPALDLLEQIRRQRHPAHAAGLGESDDQVLS